MKSKKRIFGFTLMVMALMLFGVAVAYAQNSEAMQYNANGENALDNKDYDKAIADLTQAIQLDPNYVIAYKNRVRAYLGKRDYDKAIADYTQVIRLEPNSASAYANRAEAYNKKGDYNKAIADATQAIRLDPNSAYAYHNRADAYYEKGDDNKAIADYTQAIRLNPNYVSAYHNRANAYYGKGDDNKAIADFTQAIRLNPNSAYAYAYRAEAYNEKGDYDSAIADATQVIRLDPNFSSSYRHRGFAYMQKGNYSQAREDINRALQRNPNDRKTKDIDAELQRREIRNMVRFDGSYFPVANIGNWKAIRFVDSNTSINAFIIAYTNQQGYVFYSLSCNIIDSVIKIEGSPVTFTVSNNKNTLFRKESTNTYAFNSHSPVAGKTFYRVDNDSMARTYFASELIIQEGRKITMSDENFEYSYTYSEGVITERTRFKPDGGEPVRSGLFWVMGSYLVRLGIAGAASIWEER